MTGPKEWRDLADALHDLEKHYSGSYEGALMEDAALALMDAADIVEASDAYIEKLNRGIQLHAGDTISLSNEADRFRGDYFEALARAEAAEARAEAAEARSVEKG